MKYKYVYQFCTLSILCFFVISIGPYEARGSNGLINAGGASNPSTPAPQPQPPADQSQYSCAQFTGQAQTDCENQLSTCTQGSVPGGLSCEQRAYQVGKAQTTMQNCTTNGGTQTNCSAQAQQINAQTYQQSVQQNETQPTTIPTQNTTPCGTNCNLPYTPLEPFNVGGATIDYSNIASYLNFLFKILIAIGAFIAVARITYSGFMYMLSTVITVKNDARKNIISSIWGLVLLLGVVTILATLNPTLANFDLQSLINFGGQGSGSTSSTNFNCASGYTYSSIMQSDGSHCAPAPSIYDCPTGETYTSTVQSNGSNCVATPSIYDCPTGKTYASAVQPDGSHCAGLQTTAGSVRPNACSGSSPNGGVCITN